MQRLSYDLLSVKRFADGCRACGAFSDQGVDVAGLYPLPMRLASALARVSPSGQARLLGLQFDMDEAQGRVRPRASGLLAPVMKNQVARLERLLGSCPRPLATRDGGFVYNLYQPPIPSTRFINHISRVAVQGREPVRPTTCTLQVTTRCQLNCAHCSAARFKSRKRQELSLEEWISVVRQTEDLGCYNIVFTGGEPLLRPDIFDLIRSVNPERAHAAMFSNGLLLTDENCRKLAEAGLYSLMVSVDDPRPEQHDHLRCVSGGFQHAMDGIKRGLDAGLLVGISTYATPDDVREGRPEQMIELARSLGAHEITIFDTVPTGKLLPLERESLLSPENKQRLIAMERDYNAREGYPHVITQAFINGPEGAGCFGGHAQFYMTAFGDVTPCDFTPLTFGNIRDDSLLGCWERMLSHPAYCHRCDHCRMQDPEFRHQYIDEIPEEVLLPWPATDEVRNQPHAPGSALSEETAEALPAKVRRQA